ncbi:MAG: 5-carboxymethyl-2-hydroxymuconate isomerase [Pseudomonadota bacterium]
MPHVIVDYSGNMDEALIAGLCDVLRRAAAAQPIFPADGVRVRAIRADHWSIADGDPQHAYVDISVRLREGRARGDKEAATAAIFDAARAHLSEIIATRPIMVSLEMRDIDADLAPKVNTVRDWIKAHG